MHVQECGQCVFLCDQTQIRTQSQGTRSVKSCTVPVNNGPTGLKHTARWISLASRCFSETQVRTCDTPYNLGSVEVKRKIHTEDPDYHMNERQQECMAHCKRFPSEGEALEQRIHNNKCCLCWEEKLARVCVLHVQDGKVPEIKAKPTACVSNSRPCGKLSIPSRRTVLLVKMSLTPLAFGNVALDLFYSQTRSRRKCYQADVIQVYYSTSSNSPSFLLFCFCSQHLSLV